MKELKIGLVQQSYSGNRQHNLEKSIQGIRQAAARGCATDSFTGTTYQFVLLSD